jgi:hypothetical protein
MDMLHTEIVGLGAVCLDFFKCHDISAIRASGLREDEYWSLLEMRKKVWLLTTREHFDEVASLLSLFQPHRCHALCFTRSQ